MATVFLLGPGEWQEKQAGLSPLEHRRELAKLLREHGHRVILMEDEKDKDSEDMVEKFDRLLGQSTDVVLYWPSRAKMSTTYSEMILLRKTSESRDLPRLWFLHHEDVATIERGVFKVLEPGSRSRYLTSVARLGITAIAWRTTAELYQRAGMVGAELG